MADHIGYLKLDGITGEATDSGHQGWIKIFSISESVVRPVASSAGSQRSHERATLGDVVVSKETDKSSPVLFQQCCDGKTIPTVTIDLVTSVGAGKDTLYLQFTLTNVIITSVSLAGAGSAGGGSRPQESLSMNFQRIKWAYSAFGADGKSAGSATGSWDVSKNTP